MARNQQGGRAGQKRTFRMQGLSELNKSLSKLPPRMQTRAIENASSAGAREIRKEARRLVPRGTGQLRDSIVVSKQFRQKGRKQRVKGVVFLGIKGAARYYAHLIEFGWSGKSPQPFMRTAMSNAAPRALQKMAEKLAKEIDKQARKLTGWKSSKQIKRLTR